MEIKIKWKRSIKLGGHEPDPFNHKFKPKRVIQQIST